MKAKKWIVANKVVGQPKDSDLQIVEEELPPLKDNEILCEAVYIGLSPFTRIFLWKAGVGATVTGEQVARVLESRNEDYPPNSYVVGHFGWRTHTVALPGSMAPHRPGVPLLTKLPPLEKYKMSMSLALGVIGTTGVTAYFGLTKRLQPEPGNVVLVSGAAGAVGSVVGQIARMKGCRVVGCAGTDAKCAWLKEDLGFDHVINYKTTDVSAALKEAAPNGFDCYFDNVGGDFTSNIITNHMKRNGRVTVCGCIAEYNLNEDPRKGKYPWTDILLKQLTINAIDCRMWPEEWDAAVQHLIDLVHQGKIKHREHAIDGFGNTRQAFYGMLVGENNGKTIVKV